MRRRFCLPLLLAACSDAGVTKHNSLPTAEITSHSDGDTVPADEPVPALGQVGDPDDAIEDLRLRWWADGVEICTSSAADTWGEARCDATFAEGGGELKLQVTDPYGASAIDTVQLEVDGGAAPEVEITSPGDGELQAADTLIAFRGSVFDEEDLATDLVVTWETAASGDLGLTVDVTSEGIVEAFGTLPVGEHAIRLRAVDTDGKEGTASVVISVGSGPEIAITAPADGFVANEGETISFAGTASDEEDAATALSVVWSSDQDGTLSAGSPDATGQSSASTDTLAVGAHVVTATVTDSDGLSANDTVAVVVNGLPTAPTVTLSPDPATTSDDITAAAVGATDPEGDALTHTWTWTLNGTTSGAATGAVFPATGTVKGDVVEATATPSDGTGAGPSGSASLTIINSAPVLVGPSLSATTVEVGDVLTCAATATDVDAADTPAVTYAWSGGSTGPTYTVVQTDTVGSTITCTATADDGDGGTDSGTASATVANTAPTAPGVSITPAAPVPGEDLVCTIDSASTDANGDSITYTFSWEVDGVAYAAGGSTDTGLDTADPGWTGPSSTTWTDDTVDGDDTQQGEVWTCTVTPDDGTDDGPSATASATVGCDDGSDSTCPGLDCLDLLTTDSTLGDDIYWIDPTGASAYQVWCDMTTDGGGWTLVMKAINDNFAYNDSEWTSTTLRDETDLSLTSNGSAKYQSFNEVPFDELRSSDPTTWTTDEVYTYGATQTSALGAFSSTGFLISSSRSGHFNSRTTSYFQSWGCTSMDRYGINLYDTLGCQYQRVTNMCDWNGGARFGNRVNRYGCATCGDLNGQGWAPYACGDSSDPTRDTGPGGLQTTNTITELMWVR